LCHFSLLFLANGWPDFSFIPFPFKICNKIKPVKEKEKRREREETTWYSLDKRNSRHSYPQRNKGKKNQQRQTDFSCSISIVLKAVFSSFFFFLSSPSSSSTVQTDPLVNLEEKKVLLPSLQSTRLSFSLFHRCLVSISSFKELPSSSSSLPHTQSSSNTSPKSPITTPPSLPPSFDLPP